MNFPMRLRSPAKRLWFPALLVPMAFLSRQLSNGPNLASIEWLDWSKSPFFLSVSLSSPPLSLSSFSLSPLVGWQPDHLHSGRRLPSYLRRPPRTEGGGRPMASPLFVASFLPL